MSYNPHRDVELEEQERAEEERYWRSEFERKERKDDNMTPGVIIFYGRRQFGDYMSRAFNLPLVETSFKQTLQLYEAGHIDGFIASARSCAFGYRIKRPSGILIEETDAISAADRLQIRARVNRFQG